MYRKYNFCHEIHYVFSLCILNFLFSEFPTDSMIYLNRLCTGRGWIWSRRGKQTADVQCNTCLYALRYAITCFKIRCIFLTFKLIMQVKQLIARLPSSCYDYIFDLQGKLFVEIWLHFCKGQLFVEIWLYFGKQYKM